MDFHALRTTFRTLRSKAGVSPRVAMSLMRHTDIRLTMNTYTDPRIFDLAGAVGKLTALAPEQPVAVVATGTDDINTLPDGRTKSVTSPSAQIGYCSASIGKTGRAGESTLSLVNSSNRQQKPHPAGMGKKSGRRDSNPRRQPWEGCILPLNYARKMI